MQKTTDQGDLTGGKPPVLLVTIEANPPRRIPEFVDVLDDKAQSWCQVVRNVWLVQTTHSTRELFDFLRPTVADSDMLFVVRITQQSSAWITDDARKWLDSVREKSDEDAVGTRFEHRISFVV